MPKGRAVAYNTGATINGTTQYGSLAEGTSAQEYSSRPGNVTWWMSPDENLGYIVAHPTTAGNQPNPLSVPAYVGFWRSEQKTEASFIALAEYVTVQHGSPQTFTTGLDANDWLKTNGYVTSYYNFIVSKGNITDGGFQIGDFNNKDMNISSRNYNAIELPGNTNQTINASLWIDWGGDIFDSWGYFYLYDPLFDNYLGLQFNNINLPNGIFATETFIFNSRTFTITHGYPVRGIYKFEIRVNDDNPFVFGEGGNMGSDGNTSNGDLSHPYSIDGTNLTLWYNENFEIGNINERFYSYYIPFLLEENDTKPYTKGLQGSDDLYIYSIPVTNGLTVYHSKRYDVKEWVANDLNFGE